MDNSHEYLEERVRIVNTAANVIGWITVLVGVIAIFGVFFLVQTSPLKFPGLPRELAGAVIGFACGIPIIIAGASVAVALGTQAATLQTFLNIEKNTSLLRYLRPPH